MVVLKSPNSAPRAIKFFLLKCVSHQISSCLRVFVATTLLLAWQVSFASDASDDELRREYDKIVARSFSGKEYAVRHILVANKEQAVSALQRITAGEPFAKVASELSSDPSSRNKGGELGWSLPDHFVPEFSNAMICLVPRGISSVPVQSPFGWHVIEVTDTRDQQPPPFEEVKNKIAEKLKRAKLQ